MSFNFNVDLNAVRGNYVNIHQVAHSFEQATCDDLITSLEKAGELKTLPIRKAIGRTVLTSQTDDLILQQQEGTFFFRPSSDLSCATMVLKEDGNMSKYPINLKKDSSSNKIYIEVTNKAIVHKAKQMVTMGGINGDFSRISKGFLSLQELSEVMKEYIKLKPIDFSLIEQDISFALNEGFSHYAIAVDDSGKKAVLKYMDENDFISSDTSMQVEAKLNGKAEGTFLIRKSESTSNTFVLAFVHKGRVSDMQFSVNDNGTISCGDKVYASFIHHAVFPGAAHPQLWEEEVVVSPTKKEKKIELVRQQFDLGLDRAFLDYLFKMGAITYRM